MKNLIEKIFKNNNRKTIEVKKYTYLARVFMKDETHYDILGYYENEDKLAEILTDFMRRDTVFYSATPNHELILIRAKDIDYVKIFREPFEIEKYKTEEKLGGNISE